MIQNIMVYRWNSNSESILIANLTELGYHCVEFNEKFNNYHTDAVFVMHMLDCIQSQNIHMVFSWDYFPLLAMVCEMRNLPYVSWIYDCSNLTLMSKTILYEHNYLFCFDSVYAARLAGMGCRHVYHYPLAVDVAVFDRVIRDAAGKDAAYVSDISFVGSLYNERDRRLETEGISEYDKGYIAGIKEAQVRVYGCNFVKDMIAEDIARKIQREAQLCLGDMYFDDPTQLIADLINQEITEKERLQVLEKLSLTHRLHLYTNSRYEGNQNVKLCGTVDYYREMPLVFHNSRINLNITSKTIEAGIPQRVLDILGCGGFCITNYQPEIADFFEDSKEIVMYTDMDDLVQKVGWYLRHEEERAAIARAGYSKVKECFSMREKLAELIGIVEEDLG